MRTLKELHEELKSMYGKENAEQRLRWFYESQLYNPMMYWFEFECLSSFALYYDGLHQDLKSKYRECYVPHNINSLYNDYKIAKASQSSKVKVKACEETFRYFLTGEKPVKTTGTISDNIIAIIKDIK